MRYAKTLVWLGGLCALASGAVSAQISAPAVPGQNTCEPAVSGPNQGVHSQFDGSADAIAWPPNHKTRKVSISAVNDDGDECDVTITDVRQDEPQTGAGSGNFAPDAENCSNTGKESSIDLRGERSGLGTGRYYTVSYTMDDPDAPGNPKSGTALVLTPHDQGVKKVWVNEGPLFASYAGTALSCTQ